LARPDGAVPRGRALNSAGNEENALSKALAAADIGGKAGDDTHPHDDSAIQEVGHAEGPGRETSY
jgi:hypothetical protein